MTTRSAYRGSEPEAIEPTKRPAVAAIRAWLGTALWPARWTAGFTAAYGALKAYWVLGGTALWSIAPLPQDLIDKIRSHAAPGWFEVADAASAVLAVAGVLFALATLRPRRWLPVWLIRCTLWPLAVLMVLRAVLSMPGDVYALVTDAGETRTALWDLVLWSPFFLGWGLLWAATAMTYVRRVKESASRSGLGNAT